MEMKRFNVVLTLKKGVQFFLLLFSLLMDSYGISLHFEFNLVGVIFMLSVEVLEKKSVVQILKFCKGLKIVCISNTSLPSVKFYLLL